MTAAAALGMDERRWLIDADQACSCAACGEQIVPARRRDPVGRVVDDEPLWTHVATGLHCCRGGITDTAVAEPPVPA